MRWLTVITAVFMPLTLITGVFGMNFVKMPMIADESGFWKVIGGMVAIVFVLVVIFIKLQYFGERDDAEQIEATDQVQLKRRCSIKRTYRKFQTD